MDERVTELEIKLAHAEQGITELSDVVYKQQGRIDELEQQIKRMQQRIDAANAGPEGGAPEDERPPHY